ncbi:MAG TPA: hypothetical protein VNT79_19375 [Phycisphaerae bacterium]|nr:hypothetical protein [Phycisphaerae bacterium]
MTALVQRDVLPYWRAQEPPAHQIPDGSFQVGITNAAGMRVGTTWVSAVRMADLVTVHSTTRLDLQGISNLMPFAGDLFLDADLSYDPQGRLDGFVFRMETSAVAARIKGTRYDSEFACIAQIGKVTQTMAMDAELSRYLGDSFRPFTHLENLHVGQTWRLRLIEPLAMLRGAMEFSTRLVKVERRETIRHAGKDVSCFRIETEGTVAWADDTGRVLRQEVQVPMLGKWTLEDEAYNDRDRLAAKKAMMNLREERHADPAG